VVAAFIVGTEMKKNTSGAVNIEAAEKPLIQPIELSHGDSSSPQAIKSGPSFRGLFTCRDTGCVVHCPGSIGFSIAERTSACLFSASMSVTKIVDGFVPIFGQEKRRIADFSLE
jgi:hypothetical protein